MEAILINPESRIIKIINLKANTAQEIKAEIAVLLNVQKLSSSFSLDGGMLLFIGKGQLETIGCSFVLDQTLGKQPIFGKAVLLPYKSKYTLKVKLMAMQYEARFFTKSYSNTIRNRIKDNRVAIPADEEPMGKPAKYFMKPKSETKRKKYTPPPDFTKIIPRTKNPHISNVNSW